MKTVCFLVISAHFLMGGLNFGLDVLAHASQPSQLGPPYAAPKWCPTCSSGIGAAKKLGGQVMGETCVFVDFCSFF